MRPRETEASRDVRRQPSHNVGFREMSAFPTQPNESQSVEEVRSLTLGNQSETKETYYDKLENQ